MARAARERSQQEREIPCPDATDLRLPAPVLRALAIGLGLVLAASGCSSERSGRAPAMSGAAPEATATTAPAVSGAAPEATATTDRAVSRTTSTTTTTQAEADPPVTTSPPDDMDVAPPTLEIDLSGPAPLVTVIDTEPIEVVPRPDPEPAPTTTTQAVTVPRPVTSDDDVLHLTFDDGPHPVHTPQILDVLARHGARATFFVLGRLAQAYPQLIERIAAEGHTIANHTWNHEDLAGLSRESFNETVGQTQAILGDLATMCLRPPYGSVGAHTREWAASHGLSLIMWDSSPQDWLGPTAVEVADHIVQWARPGVVLLMHDGGGDRSTTVQGLDMALERLADRGLRYEPVCR